MSRNEPFALSGTLVLSRLLQLAHPTEWVEQLKKNRSTNQHHTQSSYLHLRMQTDPNRWCVQFRDDRVREKMIWACLGIPQTTIKDI